MLLRKINNFSAFTKPSLTSKVNFRFTTQLVIEGK